MKKTILLLSNTLHSSMGSGRFTRDRSPGLFRGHIAAFLIAICFVSVSGSLVTCSAKSGETADSHGIRIESVRTSAAGYMIDLRYRIINADKAAQLTNRGIKSYLIDLSTGEKYSTPIASKVGALRSSTYTPVAGRTYFAFFANSGKRLKPGAKVQIVMGDFRSPPLVLE